MLRAPYLNENENVYLTYSFPKSHFNGDGIIGMRSWWNGWISARANITETDEEVRMEVVVTEEGDNRRVGEILNLYLRYELPRERKIK